MQKVATYYDDKTLAFSELLPYAALVDDGVVLNKDGSFLAGFAFWGVDVSSATPNERNHLCRKMNEALSSLGTGYMVHIDAMRQSVAAYSDPKDSHFPHPALRMIDESRRAFFSGDSEKYANRGVLTVTYLPPSKHLTKLTDWVFEQGDVERTSAAQRNLKRFNEKLRELEGRLSGVLTVKRLKAVKVGEQWQCELLSHLNGVILGKYHPVTLPDTPMYLDNLIGNYDFWVGIRPKLDQEYICCISIDGFPHFSSPNMLNALNYLNVEYRWSTRFVFYDSMEAIEKLKKEQSKWKQKVVSFRDKLLRNANPKVDQDALDMVNQYETAITAASKNDVKYGNMTSVIEVRNTNIEALEADAEEIAKALRNLMGFTCRIETVNAAEAFLGTLAGDGLHNVRRPLVNTLNLSHMLPLSAIWTGDEFCPCPFFPPRSPALMYCTAEGNAPFRFNTHVSDVGSQLVFGPIGSGKSTWLNMLVAQFQRYHGATVYVFDKGRSMYALSQCGGSHYEIGNKDADIGDISPSFAPMSALNTDFDWCSEYIEKLLGLQGVEVDTDVQEDIHDTLTRLRNSKNVTITDVMTQAQNDTIKSGLLYYTTDHRCGDLLDASQDNTELARFQVFEIEELMRRGEKDLVPVLLYLFRKIERSLKGQPTLIVIDEAWIALKHPVFKNMIEEWLRVLRKANCSVIMATQNIGDAKASGLLEVIMGSCATLTFLPNPAAKKPNMRPIYQDMGLNERQISLISEARPKRHYYVTSPQGNRLIDLSLSPLELAFVGVSSKDDLRRVRQCVAQCGDSWYFEWLKEQGVEE